MSKLILECIKGIADKEGINVICLQGDKVEVDFAVDREVVVNGIEGWCKGFEICFSPKQVAESFKVFQEKSC